MRQLLQRWFATKPALTAQQAARLAAWQALPAQTHQDTAHSRVVVVDVETTGLDQRRDALLSIGAVAVVDGRIALGDSFYIVLQQRESSPRENILVHGITGTVQRAGMDPAEALLTFLEFLGKSPLVAFHVTFDEGMIRRAMRRHLGFAFGHRWLDLAYVMPALYPRPPGHRTLDDWVGRFDIRIEGRHNALADALATAQLFQIAAAQARSQGIADFAGLRGLERSQRWASGVN